MAEKDYSATPLWKKLGIKEESRVTITGAPAHFRSLLQPLPSGVEVAVTQNPRTAPVLGHRSDSTRPRSIADVIVAFETTQRGLLKRVAALAKKLSPAGGLWIAYPKKTSKIPTDLTFETVQATGLEAGLVDNKSCAIDPDWSAVRFVYRLKDRAR